MPPPKRPPSAAADTIFAGIMPGGRASRTGQTSKPSTPEVRLAAALKARYGKDRGRAQE